MKPSNRALKLYSVFLLIFLTIMNLFNINRVFAAVPNFSDIVQEKYEWARPYVEKMALLGVITGRSPDVFAPDDPVKRVEFIAMIVRLMGLEDYAKNKTLPSDFPNVHSIPLWARSYVAVALEKGIISGDDYADFRPEEATKRFEAAVFAVRALGLENEAQSIKNINLAFKDTYEIPLGARKYVQLAVEKKILSGFEDGSFRPKENINRAQATKVLNQIAEYIDISGKMATGRVENIKTDFLNYIDVKLADGVLRTYLVGTDCKVYNKDQQGALKKIALKDILPGTKLRIIADGNSARYIEAFLDDVQPTTFKTVSGILKSVITGYVIVENEETKNNETYQVDASVRVVKDGKTSSFSQLMPGDIVTLMLYGEKVFSIESESAQKKVRGSVKSISFLSKNPVITLELDDGSVEDFEVREDAQVKRDGKSAELKNIKSQDEVILYVEYRKVTKIEAKSTKRSVSGVVKEISISDVSKITVTDDEEVDHTFTVTQDSRITKDKKTITIFEVKPGFYVEVEAEGDEILKMEVTARQLLNVVRGTARYVHLDAKVIVVEFKNEQGKIITLEIHFNDDTVFLKGNKEISVKKIADYVEEGDEVIAAGRYERGIFYADVVIDLVIS
ncbi:S-layer homology domain-containing protein [Thermovorax subterraneus]|nr:S-layer homology domain-containing protein [Thermovorax subterraneus]